ncbi:MAG: nucleotide exchange factor GrpE [Actinomycetota bacterium]
MTAESRRPAGAPEEEHRPAGVPQETQPAAAGPAGGDGAGAPDRSKASSDSAAREVEQDLDRLLEDTKRERDEYLDLARRTKADFENYRKRTAAEAERAEQRGKSQLTEELIGVIDNLERALAAAGVDPAGALAGEVEMGGPLEQGALLTYRELHSALKRAGVESYDPTGERFDPEWHEALSTRAEDGTDPGIVLEVHSRGYRLDGQVIRPARVVVSE